MDKSTHPLNRIENALKSFIDFLSDGLISKMPAYDGVVLLCQSEEDIVYLQRFVSSIGSIEKAMSFQLSWLIRLNRAVRNYPN